MVKRIGSLDVLKGLAIICIIFFHASVYNYANINKIDFDNPPIIVVLLSFMVLWGGILVLFSGLINAFMLSKRIAKENSFRPVKYLIIAGGIYLILHYILNIFLGRWNNDFINNMPDMTVVASSIRNMRFTFPHVSKFFDGSIFSTIGLSLIIISILLYFLLRRGGDKKERRNYWILGLLGSLIMLLSFVRIPISNLTSQTVGSGHYVFSIIYSFLVANPYPLIPYLAYGLLGAMLGLMIHNERKNLIKKIILPLSLGYFIFGLVGILNFPKTISTPDYFWYFKTHFELGIFMMVVIFFLFIFEYRNKKLNNLALIKWFARISLTIYMLETLVSEIFRKILLVYLPGWNQTINGCLVFGALNIVLWMFILYFWEKCNFKFSIEYWWVKFFNRIGKQSTKG
ncbi:MAG: acyltransferase family protein [Candidatus Pacebacteria bacterium]|nr:acyltransferase family protein [Candidatus Paceibacterota bacterium]MDD5621002.1 acyltransferase family protein [Candidatus Paceibacterota bacterium]